MDLEYYDLQCRIDMLGESLYSSAKLAAPSVDFGPERIGTSLRFFFNERNGDPVLN